MLKRKSWIGVALIPILGLALLTGNLIPSQGYTEEVKIVTKGSHGKILVLARNTDGADVYSVRIALVEGQIGSVKSSQGWGVTGLSNSSVTFATRDNPIRHGDRAVFHVVTNDPNTIVSWSAFDRSGSDIASGSTRTVVRFTLNMASPLTDGSYLSSARMSGVTTDKIFYNKNDKLFISGVLDPNIKVTVTIYAPNGKKITISDVADSSGSFDALHVLRDAQTGTYHLRATQPYSYAETAFRVL